MLASSLLVVAWRTFDDENCLSFLFAFGLGINVSKMLAKSGADRNIVQCMLTASNSAECIGVMVVGEG